MTHVSSGRGRSSAFLLSLKKKFKSSHERESDISMSTILNSSSIHWTCDSDKFKDWDHVSRKDPSKNWSSWVGWDSALIAAHKRGQRKRGFPVTVVNVAGCMPIYETQHLAVVKVLCWDSVEWGSERISTWVKILCCFPIKFLDVAINCTGFLWFQYCF